MGATVAPKGSYRRRRKDLDNIDSKHTIVE
jgi:hypothetical protein